MHYIVPAILIFILGTACAACGKPVTLTPRISSPPQKAASTNATQVSEQAIDTSIPLDQEGWQTVQTFTGQDTFTTTTFQIQGVKWRLSWIIDAVNPTYASFSAFVYPNKPGSLPIQQISSSPGRSSETVYIDNRSQDYYIKVIAANLKGWTVVVVEGVTVKAHLGR